MIRRLQAAENATMLDQQDIETQAPALAQAFDAALAKGAVIYRDADEIDRICEYLDRRARGCVGTFQYGSAYFDVAVSSS